MDYNIKFLEQLKQHPKSQDILQVALEVILQEKNYSTELHQYRDTLSRQDKIFITKCTKVLKELSIKTPQELNKQLEKISKMDVPLAEFLKGKVIPAIHFDRKLNNYQFIKYYSDPDNSFAPPMSIVEAQHKECSNKTSFDADFAKLEWKVEITLSSIKMRKVVRPLILLIIHTKKGCKKTMYLDINQFSEFRKNIALILKQVHLIESIQTV